MKDKKLIKVKVVEILYHASCSCGHNDCDHESTHFGTVLVKRKNGKPFEANFATPNFSISENEVDTTPEPGTRVRIDRNKWIN